MRAHAKGKPKNPPKHGPCGILWNFLGPPFGCGLSEAALPCGYIENPLSIPTSNESGLPCVESPAFRFPMNSYSQPATDISPEPKRGFALVITLTLMILLTVLAVGLLTLSSIALRASTQGQAMQTARENARMALLLAIGELQKYAGQDQRVTATADMAGAADGLPLAAGKPPANDKSVTNIAKGLSAVQPGTRYWTGVFANKDAATQIFTKTPSPLIVHWLVSGNTTSFSTTNPAGGPSILPADATYAVGPDGAVRDPAKAVVLVGKNSVGGATDSMERYVAAPLVEVLGKDSAKPVARFAWWVGDEGVKASINLDKTFEDKASYAALTAQRRGWETVDWIFRIPHSGRRRSRLAAECRHPRRDGLAHPKRESPGRWRQPVAKRLPLRHHRQPRRSIRHTQRRHQDRPHRHPRPTPFPPARPSPPSSTTRSKAPTSSPPPPPPRSRPPSGTPSRTSMIAPSLSKADRSSSRPPPRTPPPPSRRSSPTSASSWAPKSPRKPPPPSKSTPAPRSPSPSPIPIPAR